MIKSSANILLDLLRPAGLPNVIVMINILLLELLSPAQSLFGEK